MLINEDEKNNDISKGYGISPPLISAEPRSFQMKMNFIQKFRTNQSRYFKLSPIKAKTISFPIKGANLTLKVQVKRFIIYSIHNRYEPRFLERNIAFLELALRL
ncbi:unnamed protein product [Rhizophagus irregularis]|uniref:Uncharacterized protein n=1 Tax=Rhizophagus irregularis TaxID=588596 RepID=A0A2I1HI61_9GLOM|nr:hypothetical protein RhiirA4_480584 [Rhizophagus irregularis]CAB4414344.1 unnamed protein product [Rhizophagus irregularis]CAB4414796.1 unnamed protein product [Rhizophagus irregularis]